MTSWNRTNDVGLRRARHDKLVTAARAGAAAVEGTRFEILVTGSVARGQTHPWSDLDLLLRSRDGSYERSSDIVLKVLNVVFGAGISEVDIVPEDTVQPELVPGTIGGARSVHDIPPLADLPDPDLAPLRAAQSLEIACTRARNMIEEARTMPESTDIKVQEIIRRTTPQMVRTQLSYKAALAIKRLAVFQDGGRSAFLDGDKSEEALIDLLDRLAEPADEPFERPAMLTEAVKRPLLWLLAGDDLDTAEIDAEVDDEALDALEGWIFHLRSTTDRTDTHGLGR